MVWMAALYFTASPNAVSSWPMFLFTVPQEASMVAAAIVISKCLQNMAVILLKTVRFSLSHSAWWRQDRSYRRGHKWRRRWRHAGIGASIEEQVGLIWRAGAIRGRLQRTRRYRPDEPRRDDNHQLSLIILESRRPEQCPDDRQ